MSLTGHITSRRSPVWRWFDEHFAATRALGTEANRRLRGGPASEPCAVPSVPGSDPGLVGTAVGYVLAAHLRDEGVSSTVAGSGARVLTRRVRDMKPSPAEVERMVVARVRALAPAGRALDDDEWHELLRLCCVLSRFEHVFRSGAVGLMLLTPLLREHAGDLNGLARACATSSTLEDLSAVSRAAIADHARLRSAADLRLGPTFAQSFALGGADADIIADGELIELKSTSQAGVVGRAELWQVVGYVLADSDDAHRIRQCTVSALRRRRSVTWDAQELVDALADGRSRPVEHWRAEFAALLDQLPQRARPVRRPPPVD